MNEAKAKKLLGNVYFLKVGEYGYLDSGTYVEVANQYTVNIDGDVSQDELDALSWWLRVIVPQRPKV